jgi:predicted HicB family RNase H-like nuclease
MRIVVPVTGSGVSVLPKHPKTPIHTVRVDAELWEAARAEAARRGETVSDAIRRSLRRYVKPKTNA